MCLSIDGNLLTRVFSVEIYIYIHTPIFRPSKREMDGFLWKNQHDAQASVFDAEKTANGFFQGFSSKVPCDMMYKKDGDGMSRPTIWKKQTLKRWRVN